MLDGIFRALYRSYVEIRQSSILLKAEFTLKRDGFEALLGNLHCGQLKAKLELN